MYITTSKVNNLATNSTVFVVLLPKPVSIWKDKKGFYSNLAFLFQNKEFLKVVENTSSSNKNKVVKILQKFFQNDVSWKLVALRKVCSYKTNQ